VDRLNGVVSGARTEAGGVIWERKSAVPQFTGNRQATPADRRKQLQQLAEMGVAVPEDFRREMAMAGDWQITSERPVFGAVKKGEETEDSKANVLNVGVRKRKFEGQEEEEEAGETVVRKGWGSTTRTYPGAAAEDDDLDALLKTTKMSGQNDAGPSQEIKEERMIDTARAPIADVTTIKKEDFTDMSTISDTAAFVEAGEGPIEQEDDPFDAGVVFKKRKAKPIRQK